ncbi:MAG: hypothetical protein Q8R92_10800 [Deltaproteobacteria bacterium]|nr:hypothetical protein [Deltaproteobacteria bacterium]
MRSTFLPAVLLFFASMAFQMSFIWLDAFSADEGIVLVAADDVAKGKHLYKDIHVPLTPLVYLLQGFAFKMLGGSFLLSRLLMSILYASMVSLVFIIATSCMPYAFALVAGLVAAVLQVWGWPHAQFFTYTPLSIFFCVLAIYFTWQAEIHSRASWPLLFLGAAIAGAGWAKPNLGFLAAVGVLFYWILGLIRSAIGAPTYRDQSIAGLLRKGLLATAGTACASLPLILYLSATRTLGSMIESLREVFALYGELPPDLFPALFPLTRQLETMRLDPLLSLPGILNSALMFDSGFAYLVDHTLWVDALVRIIQYSMPLILLGTLLYLAIRLWRKDWTARDEVALLVLSVTAALYLSVIPFPAIHYLLPAQVPAVVLACFLGARVWNISHQQARSLLRASAVSALAIYLLVSSATLAVYVLHPRAIVRTKVGPLFLDPLTAQPLNEMLAYAREKLPPEATIFVFPHDALFYFLTGMNHPARFVDLRPHSPGADAEDEIIAQLEHRKVPVVFYFTGARFPDAPSPEGSYPRLHHYLTTHFKVDREFKTVLGTFAQARWRRVPARTLDRNS